MLGFDFAESREVDADLCGAVRDGGETASVVVRDGDRDRQRRPARIVGPKERQRCRARPANDADFGWGDRTVFCDCLCRCTPAGDSVTSACV
jgi:hypothetical protein